MARILEFTDLQTHGNDSSFESDSSDSKLREVWRTLLWIAELVAKEKPDAVICLGDIGHVHNRIDLPALSVLSRGFGRIIRAAREIEAPVVVLAGNHDKFSEDGKVTLTDIFRPTRAKVFSEKAGVVEVKELKVGCLPYFPTAEEFLREYERIGKCGFYALHQAVSGADYGNGVMVEDGVPVGRFRSVVHHSGHIHKRQKVDPVEYIGSALYHDFSDSEQDDPGRGAVIYDSKTGKTKRFPNPHTSTYETHTITTEKELAELLSSHESSSSKHLRLNVIPSLAGKAASGWGDSVVQVMPLAEELQEIRRLDINPDTPEEEVLRKYVESKSAEPSLAAEGWKLLKVAGVGVKDAGRAGSKIEFLKLTAVRFMSLGTVTLNLAKRGMMLVEGINKDSSSHISNGSGKSSLFEALHWCLYGATAKGVKADDVINKNHPEAGCLVSISCRIGSETYTICRSRKHPTQGTKLSVWRMDGEEEVPVTGSILKITEETVGDLLGCPEEMFRSVVYFSQGFPDPFSTWTDKGRTTLIENFINASLYEKAEGEAKTRLNSFEDKLSMAKVKLEGDERSKNEFDGLIKNAVESLKEAKQNRDAKIEELRVERKNIEDELKSLAPAGKDDLAELTGKADKAERKLSELRKKLAAVSGEITSRESHKRSLLANVESVGKLSGTDCPTCKQLVERRHLTAVAGKTQADVNEIDFRLKDYGKQRVEVSAQLDAVQQERDQLHTEKAEAAGRQKNAATKAAGYRAALNNLDRLTGQIDEVVEAVKNRLDDLKTQTVKTIEAVEAGKKRIEELEREIKVLEFWSEAFSPRGIRSYRLDGVLNYLNRKIADYCHVLFDGRITVSLSPEKQFKVGTTKNAIQLIVNSEGGSYLSCSGAETREIDLAVQLSLRDMAADVSGFRTNVLVADETLDWLDDKAVERAVGLLAKKAADIGSVFLISHSSSLKGLIPRCLTVRKRGGETTIISGG